MTAPRRLIQAEAALRRHALAFPETHEDFPWGHRALKVKGKMFVVLALEHDLLHLTVKLPVSGGMALGLPFASPTGYGLGKSGWVTARFGAANDLPLEMLREWVTESFRAVAPKKVLAKLEKAEAAAERPPLRSRRISKRRKGTRTSKTRSTP
jgi:predicted DNA-binding protein (MmcQ/YjbR family)